MKPWTNHQVRDLRNMVAAGITDDRAISQCVGRSLKSVKFKRYELRLLYPRQPAKVTTVRAPPKREVLTISKAELVEYYADGWRVAWFEGGRVGIERVP